jgi:hypothetical protein
MKRTEQERRVEALERLKASTFENSRAKRTGSLTREEWQTNKDAEIRHLEELINGRKTS